MQSTPISPIERAPRHEKPVLRRRQFLSAGLAAAGLALTGRAPAIQTSRNRAKPNVVLMFIDDMGYADIGPFGATGIATPHLDAMARRGMRFTDFHVGTAVCSASRAALLSGCYPARLGIYGAYGPKSKEGIHPDETLLSEVLKQQGYATACYGKWHLGDAPPFLPTRNGFDEYFGIPYSNDMWPHHPVAGDRYPPLPLMEDERVIQIMPDQTQLTTWYTERAIDFIERKSKSSPFFCYVPHSMVHVPLFVSEKFRGSTGSLFGDVVQEVDWSVGQIAAALQRLRIEENTLFVFTSDNGPWLLYGDHVGSALPHREGKGTTWNGGTCVPCLMEFPGRIPAGSTCTQLASTLDVLPTVAAMAGSTAVRNGAVNGRRIDGHNLASVLRDPAAPTPRETFYHYWQRELHAVRKGPWKLHLPHTSFTITQPGKDGKPGKSQPTQVPLSLYHLGRDVGEQNDVKDAHPDVVKDLLALADRARADLGDSLTKAAGSGVRSPGRVTA
jgi:arylsulfatase A-like enzyme